MAGRKPTQRIDELEDEIKHRDRRIEELRCEVDELRDLVRRMEEDVGTPPPRWSGGGRRST
jgi:predicted  nucleic acid-binding Zn-ribbon protein